MDQRRFYPTNEIREYRLRQGVKLEDACRLGGISLFRGSLAERFPDKSREGELERLRDGVDRVVALRYDVSVSEVDPLLFRAVKREEKK